ncbi:hypothetical protein JGK52_03880 [Cytobacillus oceanisediminis]|uniref:GLUG motif-containing protein n=1 Tax=Cytobacillus oceanisediminis TaxID=665099 RepID=UPI001D15D51E|nr:GLUG motif-containing protein [Cytobacillus oceanisediminis]MCC3645824.1 hypothetical protein [Cytobacillus oceanisediminis]
MAILISTPQDLHNIRNNLTGSYELTKDIDMSSWGNFSPIGSSSAKFRGQIEGKGFKIMNLTINQNYVNVGLISYAENATIQNLGIENANITSNSNNYVGIIVGYLYNNSKVINCYSTGQVSGQYGVGGLVGWNYNGLIENCYSHASVTGLGRVGGLLGNGASVNSIINRCYSTGLVVTDQWNGGLIGSHSVPTAVTNSYYDTQTSGQTISAGGIGKTTTKMKTQSTYIGWDFTTVWGMNGDYPFLQMFGVPSAPAKKETISVNSFVNLIIGNSDKYVKSTKQLQSYSALIQTTLQRNTATLRSISTYLSELETNATKFSRTVRSGIANVTSCMYPIGSFVNRESKTVRNLIAHIKPLESDISVLVPINVFTPNAYVTILENSSRASKLEGMSNVFYARNPSSVSEVMNVSEGHVIENPSHVEVMR